MKKLVTLLSLTLSLGAVAQTGKKTETKTEMTLVLSEDQMGKLFQLLNVSKGALIDTDIPGRQIKALSLYADSLNLAIQKQYTAWHPAKTDSTGKK